MIRTTTVQALEEEGYRVLSAGDGTEALAVCQQWLDSIDLVVTDVMASGMSGEDLMGYFAVKYPEHRGGAHVRFCPCAAGTGAHVFSGRPVPGEAVHTQQLREKVEAALQRKTSNRTGRIPG